jgi:YkoP domain
MRSIVLALDRLVRERTGLFEFCDDPDCVFRLSVSEAASAVRVAEGEIPAGAKVVMMHFWNEHIPPMSDAEPSISWGVKFRRMVAHSSRLLAEYIHRDPSMAGVKAVGGVTPLFVAGDDSPAEKIFLRMGFTVSPHRNPKGRFMEFWEEVYAWMLMWAFAKGIQPSLREVRRSDFWMSAEEFLRRYLGPSRSRGAPVSPRSADQEPASFP